MQLVRDRMRRPFTLGTRSDAPPARGRSRRGCRAGMDLSGLALTLLAGCGGPRPMTAPVDASPVEVAAEGSAAHASAAQSVPSTDIMLIEFVDEGEGDGGPQIGTIVQVTQREGYDNQPAFTRDNRSIYYSSVGPDLQADIFRYDLEQGRHARITQTPTSEFSPTPRPRGDGFTVIREAAPAQWLWQHDSSGRDLGIVLDQVSPVGYQVWPDDDHVAVFIVGGNEQAHRLELHELSSGKVEIIATDIGRCLQVVPNRRAFSYVQDGARARARGGRLMIYDLDLEQHRAVARLPVGVRDYAWTREGRVIAGFGSSLVALDADGSWRAFADLSDHGVEEITRLSISPDGRWLAAVRVNQPPADASK